MFISEKCGGEEQERVASPLTAGADLEEAAVGRACLSLLITVSLGDRGAAGVGAAVQSRSSPAPPCDRQVLAGEMYRFESEDLGAAGVGVPLLSLASSATPCEGHVLTGVIIAKAEDCGATGVGVPFLSLARSTPPCG